MKQITDLRQINYKTNAEGRLLFTALTILTVYNFPDKTPDEVIELLNEKSKWLDEKPEPIENNNDPVKVISSIPYA